MDTAILRIEAPPPGGGRYAVTLTNLSDNKILGTCDFARDLVPAGAPAAFAADQIRTTFSTAATDNADLPKIGAQLYALVGQDKIGVELDHNGTARRVLLDIQPPELRGLPWELMTRSSVQLLCVENRPIARGSLKTTVGEETQWPLRVLIVDGGEPAGEDIVQAGQEIADIIKVVSTSDYEADIDLLVLRRPTRAQILETFDDPVNDPQKPHQGFQPHIFHFIGHGTTAGAQSYLQLFDAAGLTSARWTASDIPTDFSTRSKPRLVILNACDTADAAADAAAEAAAAAAGEPRSLTEAFGSVGDIYAVIGMQAKVTGPNARLFSSSLYQALAANKPLDQAVVWARRKVFLAVENPTQRIEWAAPTLELSADPEKIIIVGRGITGDVRSQVRDIEDFLSVRTMVDRREIRWGAWQGVSSEALKVVVVRGEREVGKTAFVHMLMQRCALRRHQLRYLDLRDASRRMDALGVLRRICEGDGTTADELSLHGPLPAAAFAKFSETVQQVLGTPLAQAAGLTSVMDVDVRRIFQAFQAGLEQAIETPPLVIVLDQFEFVDDEQFRSFLIPHLITWCANRPDRKLLLVLLLRKEEYDRFGMFKISSRFKLVDIDGFARDQWEDLAWEYVWRNLTPPPASPGVDPVQELREQIRRGPKTDKWQPGILTTLKKVAQDFYDWSDRT